MVLVFDMVFSLLTSSDGASFKMSCKFTTTGFRHYSLNRPALLQIFRQPGAGIAAILAAGLMWQVTDR
jgi:hypothetical protein